TRFEPYHKDVTVDLFRVPERIIGDEAWSLRRLCQCGECGAGALARQALAHEGARCTRTPSSAKESCVVATLPEPQPEPSPLAEPSPTKEPDVGRTPSSAEPSPAKESLPEKQSDV